MVHQSPPEEDLSWMPCEDHTAASTRLHGMYFQHYSLHTRVLWLSFLQIRNLVQILISHPAFLEDGDTVERLQEDRSEEARLVEEDKSSTSRNGGALFKGCFKYAPRISVFDASDGVYRCPTCNWELEGTYCVRCERTFAIDAASDIALDFSDEDDAYDSESSEQMRRIYDAFDREAVDGWEGRRTPYGETPPYYYSDRDDEVSSASDEEEMRRIRQAALEGAEGSRNALGAESDDTWSGSESDSEGYETPPRSVPNGPITWDNHPNFARRTSAFPDGEYDPDIDDFIDDGSIGPDSAGSEQADENVNTDHEESGESDDDDMPMIARRRRAVLDDEEDEEAVPTSMPQDSSSAHDDEPEDHEVTEPERDKASASTPDSTPQQRKRRRMVVVDSDEEEGPTHNRDSGPRTRRRLNSLSSAGPQRNAASLLSATRSDFGIRRAANPSVNLERRLATSELPPFVDEESHALRAFGSRDRQTQTPQSTSTFGYFQNAFYPPTRRRRDGGWTPGSVPPLPP